MIDENEMLKVLEELATPIDFDKLIADGVLEQITKKKYKLLKHDGLPPHAWRKARAMTIKGKTMILDFDDCTKAAQKLFEKIR
ncbi:MAG: hypothetical protein ACQ9MH_11640 [Nitrospinales bacterium]